MSLRTVLWIGASMAAPAVAYADDAADTGPEIVVTGTRDAYSAGPITSATKTATDTRDIPQAISIVSSAQIQDQGFRSMGDLLRYVPGATVSLGEGNRDQIVLRGNGSTADFFVDGLRDDVQYYRGLYNLERVEVLKGPNAMIFGRGGGGGIVNRVTKRPEARSFAEVEGTLDQEGAGSVAVDLNRPLGDIVLGRFNAVYENLASFRDVYGGRWVGINPTVALVPDEAMRIDLSYEFNSDHRVADRGLPSARPGTLADPSPPLAGFRDTFFGDPKLNKVRFQAHVLHGELRHRFGDSLSFTSRWLYGDYDKLYQNAFPAAPPSLGPGGVEQVGIEGYRDATKRRNLLSQNDLVWTVSTGPIRHTLLAGIEWGEQWSRAVHLTGFFDSGVPTANGGRRAFVPLDDPVPIPPIAFRLGAGNRSVHGDADFLGLYVQDQIAIGDHIDIVAGLRRDRFSLKLDDFIAGAGFARTDNLWSPRLGLVLKPDAALSLYASYSRSFLPQSGDQFASLDPNLQALAPERFKNLEVGAKWELRPSLTLTIAAYRLDRTNTRAPDPNDPTRTILTGAQRSRGIELGLTGQIAPNWRVSAGTALQDARIVSTTSAAPAGTKVALVPRHQASLWTRYDFSPRLGAGLGVYAQSRSFASISNTVMLPGYARVDAAAYVHLAHGIEAQVNVENLLGARYFATASNDNNIMLGAPRTVRGTMRFLF
ncbi:MAG TPA: TonB-dependent siderophore receptor [Allosphingosinicella sp.]|nr:TonB-dependent siderophore receptor [Allosphingosinicella sp.]